MKTFPIMLDLHGRLAVVIGGGAVGLRKARTLLDSGARVKLVAEEVTADAANLKSVSLTVIAKPYAAAYLDGATLVFACTDDRALNAQIARDAHWAGALVNAADQPDDCEFFLPAVVRRGDVTVAVGTGGLAPALAGQLKERLAAALPERIAEFAALLGDLKEQLKQSVPDVGRRGAILRQLADAETYGLFEIDGDTAVRAKLADLLKDV